jgi:hypothetical protein
MKFEGNAKMIEVKLIRASSIGYFKHEIMQKY